MKNNMLTYTPGHFPVAMASGNTYFRICAFLFYALLFFSSGAHGQAAYHGGSGDGYAMAEVKNVVLGIDAADDQIQKVNLYPNPARSSSSLEILCSNAPAFKVDIINLMGQKVFTGGFDTDHAIIPLNMYAAGSYIVHIYSGNASYIQKLVIAG